MLPGFNESKDTNYTIPNGLTGYTILRTFSTGKDDQAQCRTLIRKFGGLFRNKGEGFVYQSVAPIILDGLERIESKSDIKMQSKGTAALQASVDYYLVLVKYV